jgi:hypothetical protein
MPQVHGAFNIMQKNVILGSNLTFRQLVTQQYMAMFEKIKFDLVTAQRTSLCNIIKGKSVVCMCHDNDQISSKESNFMTCCGHSFHYPCITIINKSTGLCCGKDAPPTIVPAKKDNDTVREELVKKRKKAQVHQGEKMKKTYANSLQESTTNVTQGSVVTVFIYRKFHPIPVEFWPLLLREKVQGE